MRPADDPVEAYRAWHARAQRAHGIAAILSPRDAAAVEAYAAECEAQARRQIDRRTRQPLAA